MAFPLAAIGLTASVVAGVLYYRAHRDDPPLPSRTDVDAQGGGAKVDWVKGVVKTRPARLEEYEFREPQGEVEEPRPITGAGAVLQPGSWYGLEAGGSMQLLTYGNFLLILDGPGEFLFQDARGDETGRHVLLFAMKRGTLRAKKHDHDPGHHWLQLTVPKGRLILEQGELGVESDAAGNGRFWIVSGKAVYRPNEGDRRADLPKGVYPL